MNLATAFSGLAPLIERYVAAHREAQAAELALYEHAGPIFKAIGENLAADFELEPIEGTVATMQATADAIADRKEPAASVPEARETIAADPHAIDDFHGQKVPRSSRIEMVTETHWRGWLGESQFEGAPDSVAASLRQAAADAATFIKS